LTLNEAIKSLRGFIFRGTGVGQESQKVINKTEKPIKAIVFDLGYTLIFFDGDAREINRASYLVLADQLIAAGCSLDRARFAKRFNELMDLYFAQRDIDMLELPIHGIINQALGEFGEEMATEEQITEAMHQMYLYTETHWKLEEDARSMLGDLQLSGYRMGLITNASSVWDVNNLIDQNDLRKFFSVILISGEEGIRKPDRRIFEKAAQKMEIDPSEMVMVGDTLNADIFGARQVGMKAVWISRRVENTRHLLNSHPEFTPDAEIRSLAELPVLLKSWEQ
jgi:putative hydrolase of the HAD superfamily